MTSGRNAWFLDAAHETRTQRMMNDRGFRRLSPPCLNNRGSSRTPREALLERLRRSVARPFEEMTAFPLVVIPVDGLATDQAGEDFAFYVSPACEAISTVEDCQESWNRHVSSLRRRPECHWHICRKGNCCGVVPVMINTSCVAAFKLVTGQGIVLEHFQNRLEMLDLLAQGFVAKHKAILCTLIRDVGLEEGLEKDIQGWLQRADRELWHPQVRNAIEYIETNRRDPHLTVSRVGDDLDINPTYLGNLFSTQVGMTMSQYLARRRLQLAKHFLATTDWQIKRVALESGHGNADWFSNVFRTMVGSTPSEYRRQTRGR